jgi:hypothetical protein
MMKSVQIQSINFDYIPTSMEGVKVLWVQLNFPAPRDLPIGGIVQFNIKGKTIPRKYYVYDIIGTRIVLCCHGSKSPWGFILGDYHSWNFGTGFPIATMVYQ